MLNGYEVLGLLLVITGMCGLVHLYRVVRKRAHVLQLINSIGMDRFLTLGGFEMIAVIQMRYKKVSAKQARNLWQDACDNHGYKLISQDTINRSFRSIIFPMLDEAKLIVRED